MIDVDDDDGVVAHLLWAGAVCILIFFLVALYGCKTSEALQAAPMEFWTTLGNVFRALLDDIFSVLW